ncbi:hypothetical protein MLD38_035859 [Melastoma candidum]|uniref:Uncharacterized protein n=1 Tax=Melastoma candidum TaxID=119954 RepID=A0ACB9LHW5_9MYRT|nr:hypothetical protein MLD38_035859 [Melastoma candidum]
MPTSNKPLASTSGAGIDPLLKDLHEKKQNFKRNVASLASELKEVRSRLSLQEQSFARETIARQAAEAKAREMEDELIGLQRRLDAKNGQLQASASATEKYHEEVDGLRSMIATVQTTAEASAASAQSAKLQCFALLKELEDKQIAFKEQEERANRLSNCLEELEKGLQARDSSQQQLKDEFARVKNSTMEALARPGPNGDCEIRRLQDKVSPSNIEKINGLLVVKNEELADLRDEISAMSVHWKLKAKEMDGQLEKQRRVDQEMKKRVLKLEFCLQEARSQTRKIQRMGERRDKAIKELKDQLSMNQHRTVPAGNADRTFWETPGFKILVSMSMLIPVAFSRR